MNWSRFSLLFTLISLPMMACGMSNPCAAPPDTRPLAPLNRTSSASTSPSSLPLILRDASSEAVFRRSELSNPMRGGFNWLGRVPPGSSELSDPNTEVVFSEDERTGPVADGGSTDVYYRFPWRWFFKNGSSADASKYDFSLLDQYLNRMAPADSGRKLHLGFMALAGRVGDVADYPFWRGNAGMPDYIREHLMRQNPPRGAYFTEDNSNDPSSYRNKADPSWWQSDANGKVPEWYFWPDWNDPWYISQIELFMKALARHRTSLGVPLRDDPRLGSLEVRFYGRWGEWHLAGMDYGTLNRALGLNGSAELSAASDEPENPQNPRRRILEAHANNFPNTRLALLTGPPDNLKTFRWALERYPSASWRRDSFMSHLFEQPLEQFMGIVRSNGGFDLEDPLVGNRWMTAPIWAERAGECGGLQQNPQFAPGQVERLHVSLIANHLGDQDRFSWKQLSKEDRQFWLEAILRSGFRLQLNQVKFPSSINRGGTFALTLTWDNVGVAPLYEPFDVLFELRRGEKIVWTGHSGLDLRKLLPANSSVPAFLNNQNLMVSPQTVKDEFSLPAVLEPGGYEVWVKAIDPTSRRPDLQGRHARLPLRLAHPGRSKDGAYPLGKLEVK
jgi:Domain of unknown function (DUF4832)